MFCCQFWYFEHGHPCERILYEFNEVSGWVRIVNIEGNNISIRVIINDRKQNHFQHVFLWGKSVESFLLFLPCAKYFSSIFHSHASGLNILNVYLQTSKFQFFVIWQFWNLKKIIFQGLNYLDKILN